MRRINLMIAATCACAVLVGSLTASTAGAAITASTITTPKDQSYFVYNSDSPNTFAISGTTTGGTAGDHVYGTKTSAVATNVAVSQDGSFSVPAADLSKANVYSPCRLRAVPAGTAPSNLTPFAGPRVLVGFNRRYKLSGGPNDGTPYDFYMFAQQPSGGFDYDSLSSCGVDDGYLSDSTLALTTVTFWCNAALFNQAASPGTRSELQIDGADAWPTWSAYHANSTASGFPTLTWSYHVNPHNGNLVIHDTEPLVKCTDKTYPPTPVTCPKFVMAGVTDHRTITQDHTGLMTRVTDVFTSTDGKKHSLDLLWANNQRFHGGSGGDSSQVAYKFPGQSTFSTHAVKDTVSLPKSAPATILVNMKGAADGDTSTGQGAIVYDRPATKATFVTAGTSNSQFTLHQTGKVPAKGSTRFRFAYAHGFMAAGVAKLATQAVHSFTSCVVPQVTGKPVAAAKKAITHGACLVGKIRYASSATVKKGRVISQQPKAGKKLAYHAKVSLLVSKG